MNFKFQKFAHRMEGVENVKRAASRNWNSFMACSPTKQDHIFLILSGGSGSGKTRAANEVGNILRVEANNNELPQGFSRTCELYIDFSKGEKISTLEYDLEPSYVLGLRLFAKALREEATVQEFMAASSITQYAS